MIGEFPGLGEARPRRQPPRDGRLPRALRGAARGLARHRRRGDHPGRAEVPAAEDRPMRRASRSRRCVALALPPCRAPLPRAEASRPALQVVADEFTLTLSRATIRHGDGRRRARQLRRGRPRSRAPPRRRDAHVPRRHRPSRARVGRARPRACAPAATRSGARSPTTARAGCERRSWFASYRLPTQGRFGTTRIRG